MNFLIIVAANYRRYGNTYLLAHTIIFTPQNTIIIVRSRDKYFKHF